MKHGNTFLIATLNVCSSLADSSEALKLCQTLHQQLPTKLTFDPTGPYGSDNSTLTADFNDATSRYWDAANNEDHPACALFPSSASDVSAALKLLNAVPRVPFALQSGGHNWNRGFSSLNGGLLISFRPNMNYTTLAPGGESAEVGPGTKWTEIMTVLDKSNKCAVGGRSGDVGVGGYVILGGLSYLTSQYVSGEIHSV
jgi:hypothetical protein